MSRESRFREIGKHAIPDHRLQPQEFRDMFDKLPRNERRLRKKIIDESLRIALAHAHADHDSGAGYPIDKQLREYLAEYNERQLGHGLRTLPASFNVLEGFFEFRVNYPAAYFAMRPEKDHLFSLADFLDFMTGDDRPADAIGQLVGLPDGIIYNFTSTGDIRDLAFLHADSRRFVIAGFTMVRREEQLHWAMVGGPICDLAAQTDALKTDPIHERRSYRPPEKAFIDVNPDIEYRAEPLDGTDDVWKTVIFGRFNLSTRKHEARAIARDHGNSYDMIIDDPDMFGIRDPDHVSRPQREMLDNMMSALETESLLFEIAETCFQLPGYFAYRITLVRDTKRETAIASLSSSSRSKLASVAHAKRPLFRMVAALDVIDIGRTPVVRSYSPPQYKVEVDGFWRRLDPDTWGRDGLGNATQGRTWVKGHLRWRDRPERHSTIFVKSSVAAAKAKAAAILASDATASVVSGELPPVFPVEVEPEAKDAGWLYVMRCPLMDDDVYKVGWSSRPPKTRAEELSKATGVPMAYIVVESWSVQTPRRIEAIVHIALTTYRINPRREFFRAPFDKIRAGIISVLSQESPLHG